MENVLLGKSRSTEQSERSRGVTSSSPAPTTVQAETLIGNDLEDATATESLGVCLTLDLEDVKR